MRAQIPPITKVAERLLLLTYQAVVGFPQAHKHDIGKDLRQRAFRISVLVNRAWRDRARQAAWIDDLIWAVDEIRIAFQLGKQLKVFRGFSQFEELARIVDDLGRQAGGWKRQHASQAQNASARSAPSQRGQKLSTHAASIEANP